MKPRHLDDSIAALTQEAVRFRDERDWSQFHTARNLATALSIEASEIQEILLWKSEVEVAQLVTDEGASASLRHEIADVLIYALLFCNELKIDIPEAIREKLELNRTRYPVELARGKATKYTDLGR
jgi:NTP pyrophosphatase (non-canonical NTP hydrolase)